jgi:hypothetical protein
MRLLLVKPSFHITVYFISQVHYTLEQLTVLPTAASVQLLARYI